MYLCEVDGSVFEGDGVVVGVLSVGLALGTFVSLKFNEIRQGDGEIAGGKPHHEYVMVE